MLNEVKHPCNGFLARARNDIFGLVMLSEAKHPYWIDLTLFAGANVPFLLQEEGQKVVYLSKRAYR